MARSCHIRGTENVVYRYRVTACIVLAGGAGRRMGGADKAALRVGDVTLLDRVLAAARPLCSRLVVVGPTRATTLPGIIFTMEERRGGGPVPAILAGMNQTGDAAVVFVLAVDLPFLTTGGLDQLLQPLRQQPAGATAAADGQGRANPLLAAIRTEALQDTAGRLRHSAGSAASRLLPDDTITVELEATETFNVNTPSDLAAAQSLAGGQGAAQPFSKRDSGLSSM